MTGANPRSTAAMTTASATVQPARHTAVTALSCSSVLAMPSAIIAMMITGKKATPRPRPNAAMGRPARRRP